MNCIEMILLSAFAICLLLISIHDFKFYIIPDRYLKILFVLGIVFCVCGFTDILNSLLGFVLNLFLMSIIYFISKGGMGFGDVKLSAVLGLWLGVEKSLMMLLLSFISGAIVGVGVIVTGYRSRDDCLPFGPFLCISAVCVVLYYDELLAIYKQILNY